MSCSLCFPTPVRSLVSKTFGRSPALALIEFLQKLHIILPRTAGHACLVVRGGWKCVFPEFYGPGRRAHPDVLHRGREHGRIQLQLARSPLGLGVGVAARDHDAVGNLGGNLTTLKHG
jgi:hypothetical protein